MIHGKALMMLVLALVCSAGASAAPPARHPSDQITVVELDIYSGRTNPSWTLSPRQSAALLDRLNQLPRAVHSPLAAGTLGYRGFTVMMPDGVGRRQHISVGKGVVAWRSRKVILWLTDPQRGLEAWLLQSAGNRIAPELKSLVSADITAPR